MIRMGWRLSFALVVGLGCVAGDLLAAQPGKLTGSVNDLRGHAVAEARVRVSGPCQASSKVLCTAFRDSIQKLATNVQGKFSLPWLVPGWYLVVVTTPPQLSAVRVISKLVHVTAAQTTAANFTLTNFRMNLQAPPNASVRTQGESWKWVLRGSQSTRPVLRFRDQGRDGPHGAEDRKEVVLPANYLVGLLPREPGGQPLAENRGMTSVFAYSRPLSADSELLVAGGMGKNGESAAASLATAFRGAGLFAGSQREVSVAVHKLGLLGGLMPSKDERGPASAQGIKFSYAETRELLPDLLVTAGLEADYFEAADSASAFRPHLELVYRQNPQTTLAVRYTSHTPAEEDTLVEQVGRLNAFPRITMRGFRPELEKLNHVEAGVEQLLPGGSKLEVAAYMDRVENTALLGLGNYELLGFGAGDLMPSPSGRGIMINAGDFRTSGFRAAYEYEKKGQDHWKAVVAYAYGGALVASDGAVFGEFFARDVRRYLQLRRAHALTGKWIIRIPYSDGRITASYQWTSQQVLRQVDPFGQTRLHAEPFLGITIRQPLPAISFLPGRVEALADFRNLLAQGYFPVAQRGEEVLFLTPSYRTFRGGFSLLF